MAGIGDNVRAETVSDRLELDYGELLNGSTDAIAAGGCVALLKPVCPEAT
jgi:hypothetical protein